MGYEANRTKPATGLLKIRRTVESGVRLARFYDFFSES